MLLFITTLLLLGVVSFSFARDQGDAYISASIGDARTLIPILSSDTSSSAACSLIFNGLLKYDKDIKLTGDLAQSWEVLDQGLTFIFHLRKGVKWHDGVEFCSGDVQFTFDKIIDPGVKTPYSADFEKVEKFEVIDNYTLKIKYKEPFAPALGSWTMWVMPKHVLEKEDLNNSSFARNPVGTGPYKFKKWLTQEKIELVANPDYFGGRPYVDSYVFRVIPDPATIFLELQMENIDASIITPLQYSRQTDTVFFRKHFSKYRLTGSNYVYLGYNLKKELFSDLRVRQALNYAADKEEIIKVVLLGMGKVCTGPFLPESWAYNPGVKPAAYNPELARGLLKEAGWNDADNDGVLEKGGRKFEFTIITNQGNDQRRKVCEIIQRRLSDVGVRVKIKVIEWSVFLGEYIDKRDFDAVLLGWNLGFEPDIYDIWHSSKTKEGEFNFVGYCNNEVDKLLDMGRREYDLEKRRQYYNRIHEIIYREQPYMFLYVPDSLFVINKRFRGVEQAPLGIGWNFTDWWVPKQEQKYKRNTRAPEHQGTSHQLPSTPEHQN